MAGASHLRGVRFVLQDDAALGWKRNRHTLVELCQQGHLCGARLCAQRTVIWTLDLRGLEAEKRPCRLNSQCRPQARHQVPGDSVGEAHVRPLRD